MTGTMSNDAQVVTEVRRDGEVVATFRNDGPTPSANQAFAWLQRHVSYSWDHACKYEGYSVVDVNPDGSEYRHA